MSSTEARTGVGAGVKARLGSIPAVRNTLGPLWDRYGHGRLGRSVSHSRRIPGWTGGDEGDALMYAARALPPDAVVVEIGAFLGRSTVLLAGGLQEGNGGTLHVVDPFDGSGDAFSVPVYDGLLQHERTARERFEENIRKAGLAHIVEVHAGTAESVGPTWSTPIDLLFLDGDQSPAGAFGSFELFAPHLVPGGLLAVHNSDPGEVEHHDGPYRLVQERLHPPDWGRTYRVGTTTFVRKTVPST